jgi:hypothetical protein
MISNDLHEKLSTLDPAAIDAPTFLQLVEILDGQIQGDKNVFKMSDKLLTEFSKAPNSWEIVF